jgi:hypothetical protein
VACQLASRRASLQEGGLLWQLQASLAQAAEEQERLKGCGLLPDLIENGVQTLESQLYYLCMLPPTSPKPLWT